MRKTISADLSKNIMRIVVLLFGTAAAMVFSAIQFRDSCWPVVCTLYYGQLVRVRFTANLFATFNLCVVKRPSEKHVTVLYRLYIHWRLWFSNVMCFCVYRLIESETKSPTVSNFHHQVQPPSDPIIASVLHSRQNPRPGRLLLENVNNRPQTMDRGTQANTDIVEITDTPSTSNDPTSNELVS